MSVKMIADFRRRPSLARRKAARIEKEAELDRIVAEEIRRAAVLMGIGYAR